MRRVILEGELGEKFGKERMLNVKSFRDIIKCFQANFDNFNDYLLDCDKKQIMFICRVNGVAVDENELIMNYPNGDFVITPVPAGALSLGGLFKAIVGIVLVVVGIITMNPKMIIQGIGLFISGVQDMLAQDPSVDERTTSPDYLYGGTEQLVRERDPIPLCYGRMRIPARPISFETRQELTSIYSHYGNQYKTDGDNTRHGGGYGTRVGGNYVTR